MSISSPIATPMSGTFPRQESQELNAMAPRQYAPLPPPPVPNDPAPFRRHASGSLPTPDISPVSNHSIDERIDASLGYAHARDGRGAGRDPREGQPAQSHSRDPSATNTTRTAGNEDDSRHGALDGDVQQVDLQPGGSSYLPKPGVNRFPSLSELPKSPVPGQSFPRFNSPSAIRTDGGLPLRAYEPSLKSPSQNSYATKQTVFTRAGPMSPGAMTEHADTLDRCAGSIQPVPAVLPVVPITPSLVTKADRKRMRKLEPKTPTVEMVPSQEDIW